jgi:hypothetical protein
MILEARPVRNGGSYEVAHGRPAGSAASRASSAVLHAIIRGQQPFEVKS